MVSLFQAAPRPSRPALGRRLSAPIEHRRATANLEPDSRRDDLGRPAPAARLPSRCLRPGVPPTAPVGCARIDRAVAGSCAERRGLRSVEAARQLLHLQLVAAARPFDPVAHGDGRAYRPGRLLDTTVDASSWT